MLSCARATRGLRRPSLDTRSGRPFSPPSRKRWNSGGCSMRAVKDSSATPMGERCDGAEKETEGPRLGYILWGTSACRGWTGGKGALTKPVF